MLFSVWKLSIWCGRLMILLLVAISIWNSLHIDYGMTNNPAYEVPTGDVLLGDLRTEADTSEYNSSMPTIKSSPINPLSLPLKISQSLEVEKSVSLSNKSQNESSSTAKPIRVLLAIESEKVVEINPMKRRRLARKTYLDFDRLHRPNEPNRVCTFQEYLGAPDRFDHCRLIYTFVVGPKKSFKSHDYGSELPASIFENRTIERDLFYLNVEIQDRISKRWGWFRAISARSNDLAGIAYAAYTDCQMLIQPTKFWDDNPLFRESPPTDYGIYAGLPVPKERCQKDSCRSLIRDTFMDHFFLLSLELVNRLAMQPILKGGSFGEWPDVAVANALAEEKSMPIRDVELEGLELISIRHPTSVYLEHFVYRYDVYKDELTNYTDPVEETLVLSQHPSLEESSRTRKPRLLLGIFSMDSPMELQRRETIRSTYLQAFVHSGTPNRICSITELEMFNEHDKNECEITYVFVVGGHPNGSTELLEVNDTNGPVALSYDQVPATSRLPDHDKSDIAYLNIQENMEDGKSPTYFKFATLLLDEHYFDYIAKTDTDTIVYPEALLQKVIYKLPKFPDNVRVYAGHYALHPTQEPQLGPAYMEGRFYMMTPDLARFITSPALNRTAVDTHIEDMSIGNYIHFHPLPIQRKGTVKKQGVFDHPVKDVDEFRAMWNASLVLNR